ncbi:MAG: hypothetical protein ACP5D1_04240 [Bacteroidales bacterium]
MTIEIRQVKTRRDLKTFIHLPEQLHRNHANWVPPVYVDEYSFFNPAKNKCFEYSDTLLCLALQNGRPVGRIMGIINHRYNERHHDPHARFAFMECPDDTAMAHTLLQEVESWALHHNMPKIVGPMGFSDKDPQGFQIEGFEYPPILATATNLPYMPSLVEKEGYRKKVDLRDYIFIVPEVIPEIYKKISQRFSHRDNFRVLEFKNRRELKPLIHKVFELMNETYTDIFGFDPLNKEEMDELAARYLPVIDPKFVKMVSIDHELTAFVVGMPDICKGIQRAGGRLLPFGWWHILRSMKTSRHLTLLLGGIKPSYRGLGLDAIMGIRMLESCMERGITLLESHLILETNTKMIAELEKLGAREHKRFRIYEKNTGLISGKGSEPVPEPHTQ